MNFSLNQRVQYKEHQGFVSFIDQRYITICIGERDKTPEEQSHSKQPKHQCNLLVFPEHFEHVKLIHIG
jgi:hypothetical protein